MAGKFTFIENAIVKARQAAGFGAVKEAEREAQKSAGFLSRAGSHARDAAGSVALDAVGLGSGAFGGDSRLGSLAKIGLGAGAIGIAAVEMAEIIRIVKAIAEFVHDPKQAMAHLFGEAKNDGPKAANDHAGPAAEGALLSGLGARADGQRRMTPAGFEASRVVIHTPGDPHDKPRLAAWGPGGPRSAEHAYAMAAAAAEQAGAPIRPGAVFEMEFWDHDKRTRMNVEAVDRNHFLPISGQNGRSQFVPPSGFTTPAYAAEAARRVESGRAFAVAAQEWKSSDLSKQTVSTGPAGLFVNRADGATAVAMRAAAVNLGAPGLGGGEVGSRRPGAPDDSVGVFATDGVVGGVQALHFKGLTADGAPASIALMSKGRGEADSGAGASLSLVASVDRPGLKRMAVVTGHGDLGGVDGAGRASLTEEGRGYLRTAGEAAGRRIDMVLAGTKSLGAERQSAVMIDRDAGRAVEAVWSGDRMVVVSDGRVDFATKGKDGAIDVRTVRSPEISVDAKTGVSRMPPAVIGDMQEFARPRPDVGQAFAAGDVMRVASPKRAARGGIGD